MYVKVKDGVAVKYPYWSSDLRNENPNTSFPQEISDDLMASFGAFRVVTIDEPLWNYTKNIREDMPVKNAKGEWQRAWTITDASPEEIEQRTNDQANGVRENRKVLLQESDWTQTLDAPVDKEAWAAYRQALRDISTQPGFPWEVNWPKAPE